MLAFKALRKRFFSDRADSILVPALLLIPAMAIAIGVAVEVQKNNYVRSERINAIQDSASSAVTLTDSRGSLNWRVVDRIVNEYEHNRFGERTFSSTDNRSLRYDTGVRETTESRTFDGYNGDEGADCLVGTGDDEGQRYPQYTITLAEGRGETGDKDKSVSFTRTQAQLNQLNRDVPLDPQTIYRSVRVDIVDQTPNILLGMAGMSCQKFTLSGNAVTFSADADIP